MNASADAAPPRGHTPVLYQHVLAALRPRAGARYIDGTVGAGGHAAGILQASSPDGELLGLDLDRSALELAAQNLRPFRSRLTLRHGSYAMMASIAAELGWTRVSGILLDLGLSSVQMDDPQRGFSLRADGPLDMRFDRSQETTAADLVNHLPQEDLAELLRRYGEEPRARAVARAIVSVRPLSSTRQLADVVASATRARRRGMHPATLTFQALRIAVNAELDNLRRGLEQAMELLEEGGRLAVIAFHSSEDRIVKRFMRTESQDCICPPGQPVCNCDHHARLTLVQRRPVKPDDAEISANPRARSARLRVAEKVGVA